MLDTYTYGLACLICLTYALGKCLANTGRPSIIEQGEGLSLYQGVSAGFIKLLKKKLCAKLKSTSGRGGGGGGPILWLRSSRTSTTLLSG